MATTIKLKNSVTTTVTPSSLAQGEMGINITDKKLWVGDASNSPVLINDTMPLTNPTVTNYTETLYAPSAGSAFTVSLANGTVQKFTTNANVTITLPSSSAGKSYVIIVAYGGTHTLTWAGGSTIKWPGGTAPTASSANGKFDIFTFFCDGTNTYGQSFGLNY